jgi:ribose/xylose/arabinose/galactoside ABC-type transport system permease subunit
MRDARKAGVGVWLRQREAGIGAVLVLTILAVTAINPSFAAAGNLADMLAACAPCIIVGCGVALVVITGEIDISVGSLYGLLGALMGVLASPTHAGLPIGVVVIAVPLAGLGIGLASGALVALARIPSIIVTLGMLTILRGVTEVILGGEWVTDLPRGLRALGTARPLGLAWAVWVAAVVLLAGLWLTRRTPLGRRAYAVGSNPEAARLAGINIANVKLAAFGLSGLLTGVAALVSVPQLSVIESGLGVGFELLVVTAVVVGGVSIRGGVGSLVGVALAAILLGIVRTVLVFLKLGPAAAYWERAVHGAFILAAVVLDHLARAGRGGRLLAPAHAGARAAGFAVPHWVLLLLATGAVLVGAGIASPEFLRLETQLSLLPQAAELALLAVPMTLVILAGGIDLSVASIMALASVCVGLAYQRGMGAWPAAGLGILAGGAAGLLNGAFIANLRIHPLIVTLATLSLFRGLAEGLSGGGPVSGFPESLTGLAGRQFAGVPVILLPVAAAYIAAGALLWRAVAGRDIRAIGFNETACRFSAVPVERTKLALYAFSGASAGFAAVILLVRRNTASPDAGLGIELDVITAVLLGGTAVTGGRGSLMGTLAGVLLLHEIRQFVAWRWYHDELVLVVVGAVLITSVLFGQLLERRRD